MFQFSGNFSDNSSPSGSSPTATAGARPNHIGRAILRSLFTPHRQIGLPTCNMNAMIVNETLNNPAMLARIFCDILTRDPGTRIRLASDQEITLQSATKGGGGCSMEVRPSDPANGYNQTYLLSGDGKKDAGIELVGGASSPGETVGLRVPINDLNDALLANLMQNVYGGEGGVPVIDGFIRSRELYFGVRGDRGFLDGSLVQSTSSVDRLFEIDTGGGKVEKINIPARLFGATAMAKLAARAGELQRDGFTVASTMFSQPGKAAFSGDKNESTTTTAGNETFTLDKIKGHVENLYLGKIANIMDLKDDEYVVVGDRNWCDAFGEPYYLAIQKMEKNFAFTTASISRPAKEVNLDPKDFERIGQMCTYGQKF
jgi:hypothetical protein